MRDTFELPTGDVTITAAMDAIAASPTRSPTQSVRELKGLSQDELARRSGVGLADILRLEDGSAPDVLLLATVAYTLHVPAALLLR
jgi:hypothetical protein